MTSQAYHKVQKMLSFHTFFPKSTRYEKFINLVSDSILQLIFKKAPFKFGYTSKENTHNYLKILLKRFTNM